MEEKSRKLKVYGGTNKSYQTIPQIKFEGQWLEALGFSVGDKIQLDCEENKITITKAGNVPTSSGNIFPFTPYKPQKSENDGLSGRNFSGGSFFSDNKAF